MKTETLIRLLAEDGSRPVRPIAHTVAQALALGAVISLLFLVVDNPRPDIMHALLTARFDLKLAVVMVSACAAATLLVDMARPAPTRHRYRLLLIPPLLLVGGVLAELATVPSRAWEAHLIGHHAIRCVATIPVLSLPPLACLLVALRSGASQRPALTGATAGLLSAAAASSVYALTCRDDSPLFIATWYSLAIATVCAVSAWLGARLLRW